MLKKIIILLLVYVTIYSQSGLKDRIDKLISKIPRGTIAAIEIIDANTGESIYENEATKHVIPASNAKLFSTATALSIMGVSYEFETRILTEDKNIADNTIDGNLYLQGLGNSLFSEKDLDDFVSELKKLNISEIKGDIIGDDSIWDNNYFRQDWIEGETANVFVPAVSAIVLNRNMLTVNISGSSKVKGRAIVSLNTENEFIDIQNSCLTVKRKGTPSAVLNFSSGRFTLDVTGRIGRNVNKSITVKIKNPAIYAASVLYTKIKNAGITVLGLPKESITVNNAVTIKKCVLPLVNVVNLVNKRSDNFLAECLFKSIGAYTTLKQGNAFYSTQAINQFINNQNIYNDEVEIVDGSGISRSNNVTVKTMAQLLYNIYSDKKIFDIYKSSLAVSGLEGTLRRRMKNGYEGKFYGKTGTLNGVSSLTGYYEPEEGRFYIVSMVFQFGKKDHSYYKDIQDKIVESIY